MNLRIGSLHMLGTTVACLVVAACDVGAPTASPPEDGMEVEAMADIVAADLAYQLTEQGLFQELVFPVGADRITPEVAQALALQYANEFLVYQDTRLERQHGANIDFASLTVDPRVELAETPYVETGGNHGGPLKRALGSFYLVTLRSNGVPAISVGVSVHATNLAISGGHLVAPSGHGNEFRSAGIPVDGSQVLTPERAARIAATATGGVVSSRPRFIREGFRFFPQRGIWTVEVTGEETQERILLADDGTIVGNLGSGTVAVEAPIGGARTLTLVRDGTVTRADIWARGGGR